MERSQIPNLHMCYGTVASNYFKCYFLLLPLEKMQRTLRNIYCQILANCTLKPVATKPSLRILHWTKLKTNLIWSGKASWFTKWIGESTFVTIRYWFAYNAMYTLRLSLVRSTRCVTVRWWWILLIIINEDKQSMSGKLVNIISWKKRSPTIC